MWRCPLSSPFDPDTWPDPATFPGAEYAPALTDQDAPGDPDQPPPPEDTAATAQEETAEFVDWVRRQLLTVEAYGVDEKTAVPWCPRWWVHPEAVERLRIAYKGYLKSLRLEKEGDGLALSSWWVYHWDHHARIIFDPRHGPFRWCNRTGHHSKSEPRHTPLVDVHDPDDGWLL